MKHTIARRVGHSLLSLTNFRFIRLPGDPTSLLTEPGASEADIAAIKQKFGRDQPLWTQYAVVT